MNDYPIKDGSHPNDPNIIYESLNDDDVKRLQWQPKQDRDFSSPKQRQNCSMRGQMRSMSSEPDLGSMVKYSLKLNKYLNT